MATIELRCYETSFVLNTLNLDDAISDLSTNAIDYDSVFFDIFGRYYTNNVSSYGYSFGERTYYWDGSSSWNFYEIIPRCTYYNIFSSGGQIAVSTLKSNTGTTSIEMNQYGLTNLNPETGLFGTWSLDSSIISIPNCINCICVGTGINTFGWVKDDGSVVFYDISSQGSFGVPAVLCLSSKVTAALPFSLSLVDTTYFSFVITPDKKAIFPITGSTSASVFDINTGVWSTVTMSQSYSAGFCFLAGLSSYTNKTAYTFHVIGKDTSGADYGVMYGYNVSDGSLYDSHTVSSSLGEKVIYGCYCPYSTYKTQGQTSTYYYYDGYAVAWYDTSTANIDGEFIKPDITGEISFASAGVYFGDISAYIGGSSYIAITAYMCGDNISDTQSYLISGMGKVGNGYNLEVSGGEEESNGSIDGYDGSFMCPVVPSDSVSVPFMSGTIINDDITSSSFAWGAFRVDQNTGNKSTEVALWRSTAAGPISIFQNVGLSVNETTHTVVLFTKKQ